MNISPTQIAMVTASAAIDVARFAGPLTIAMEHYDINSARRLAGFLAQSAWESVHFRHTEELLGYSAQRLMEVWPKRFPTLSKAKPYAYNPQALANFVYANRMGNGDEASGDGWNYRGRGLFQLTGKTNYELAESALGMSITADNSFRVALPDGAAWTAAWYWYSRNCNAYADRWDLAGMTRAINGGLVGFEDGNRTGLDDRVELCTYALDQVKGLGSALFDD